MKVYTDYVPEDCDFLTAGKRYDFFSFIGSGHIIDDDGVMICIRLESCAHLNNRPWKTEQ